jgi:hydrogenase maturation factor
MEDRMISLAHGSGGKLSRRLIEETILPRFTNTRHARIEDGA